ncbi:MAG TPA: hypothetical protein VIV40_36430, partial [Kofleriaceae bacterium]
MRSALVAGLVLASSTSLAAPHPARLRDRTAVSVMPARSRSAFDALARDGWRASWDRDTGVPARLWGSYVDAPGSTTDGAVAERIARQFLAQHLDLLAPGARLADFVVVANQLDADIRTVGFSQTYRGVPVVGGQLGFVFAHDRLFAIGSSAWPDIVAAPTSKTHVILPQVSNGAIAYHAASITEDREWRVYRDADGRELARESRINTASGTLEYNVGVRYAGGTRADVGAPTANITV